MKKIYFYILVFLPFVIAAQSISASKLLSYANSQNINIITKELKQIGFQTKTDNSEGYPIYQFLKKTSKGTESIEMGKNTELFMFTYKPSVDVYIIIKNKILTPDFQFAYSYKNANYYENGNMRIGANDISGIISVFKPLKK